MLEESIMDKKSTIRTSHALSRPQAVECKKPSESSNKPCSRQNKKRESSAAPKNDSNRRNGGQMRGSKTFDKRPKPRAYGQDAAVGGNENTGLAQDNAELGSVFVSGSKKQSLNHLLNFQCEWRGSAGGVGRSVGQHRVPNQRRRLLHSEVHTHNRELFLQANCQFVVRADGDYSVHLVDPDIPVKWDQIEQIIVGTSSELACPVCLHAPVAARMTRCGHVYCWPCALHYLALSSDSPSTSNSKANSVRPCPVCAQAMDAKTLKSVRMYGQTYSAVGSSVVMQLVRRRRGAAVVEAAPPRDGRRSSNTAHLASLAQGDATVRYAKLLLASQAEVKDIIKAERKQLLDQIQAEIDISELCFIEQALELLNQREQMLDASRDLKSSKVAKNEEMPEPLPDVAVQYEKTGQPGPKLDWFNMTAEEEPEKVIEEAGVEEVTKAMPFEDYNSKVEDTHLNPDAKPFVLKESSDDHLLDDLESTADDELINMIDKENQANYFYFYQAADGQAAFLHSINIRILNASWGSLARAPLLLEGRLLRRESGSATNEVRRRMPCASHLALHCPFDMLELDLVPPDVTRRAINQFKEELSERRRARERNENSERKREHRIRLQESGALSQRRAPDTASLQHFPTWQSPPSPGRLDFPTVQASPPRPPTPPAIDARQKSRGPSFAKMASTSGVWSVRPPRAKPISVRPPIDSDEEEERAHTAPHTHTHDLAQAIQAALHATHTPNTTHTSNTPTPNTRKKKNKGKVLFATGMHAHN